MQEFDDCQVTFPRVPLASSDHVARLWDLNSGETVRQYSGHHRSVGLDR